ncbi:MFS transporter [Bacillus sp. FJAT-42376]|uniref:MFS transporter n=1 Tax=Bacillus sp. FJAT-42376 TaxID=2014076 RepID=UPI000F503DD5|nr:MFS transporter [Bacillus sp. FJAT-42376]AZB43180.1 MFS transporter [Bacillus sp. FJAT-42376]
MWKNKNVWIILAGEFIAGLGLWMGIIGNLEFMQTYIPSDFLKSLLLIAGLLAGVAFGPLAGRIIDSRSKKKVMIISGIGRMLSVLFMFAAISYGSVWLMLLFLIGIQVSAAFYFPALQAAIPVIVKEEELVQMNGVHMNVATLARVIGTALAGMLLSFVSLSALYALSMAAYGVLLGSTFFLQLEEAGNKSGLNRKANRGGFLEVLPILKKAPIALTALILTIIPMLFIGGFNLMVINISELQNSTAVKGLLYTVEGLSFMLGALIVKKLSDRYNHIVLMILFAFITSIAHLSLFFSDHFWMSLFSFGLFGLSVGCFFPIASTIFQTRIDKEYHGRFFSFRNMLDRIMFQVVLLGTGLLLDTIGLQYMVVVFGAGSMVLVLLYGRTQLRMLSNQAKPTPLPEPKKASS